jgi:hypothetical protein
VTDGFASRVLAGEAAMRRPPSAEPIHLGTPAEADEDYLSHLRHLAPADREEICAIARDLLDASSKLRKASDALAASRAATTTAIARLMDVENRANALLAVLSIPTPGGTPS